MLGVLLGITILVYQFLQLRLRKIREQHMVLEGKVSIKTSQLELTNRQIVKQRDELEYHRNHLEELISDRTSELESAKLQAEESSRLKTAFLANMSHEIRTPLNSIVNFSQLLFDQNLREEDRKKFKDIVETSSTALLRLIEDVLDIARLEAGELSIEIKPCDIASMIRRLGETYKGKIRVHDLNIRVSTKIPEEYAFEIETDVIRLNQILVNLLDNAVKFTEAGEVTVGFVERGEELEFFVQDTGIGIASKNIDKVFDRFTKIEEDRRKLFPGAGLGLAIAKRLVSLLGGAIRVESEEGKGSVFYFTIPNKVFVQSKSEDPVIKTTPYNYNWKEHTILIVEDEYSNVEVLKAFLAPTAANLIYAEDGAQAVSKLKSNSSIDLVLMDLKLPVLDGVTATQEIRTFNRKIPIIAQTAFGVSHERMETLKNGFNDYVTKPLNRDRLLSSIDHHLKKM